MRIVFFLVILVLSIVGSGYGYTIFDRTCKTPVIYRIGTIDARFNTTPAELMGIAAHAEKVWEEPLNKELFLFAEDGDLPINLIFDERQEMANRKEMIQEDLDVKEGMTEAIAREYEGLVEKYRPLQQEYENRVQTYNARLDTYNTDVDSWNKKGGAPKEIIAQFEQTRAELKREDIQLMQMNRELNDLVTKLNTIRSKGASVVSDFNTAVDTYNNEFGESHEFTQGDYSREEINVYQFNSSEELKIVLAHELGHALALNHTENEKSIMYPTQAKQVRGGSLTQEDRAEFERVCKERSFHEKVLYGLEKTWLFALSGFSR